MTVEDFDDKYPFVYEVNRKLYILGRGVYTTYISGLGIRYFRAYRRLISKIGRDRLYQRALAKEEKRKLFCIFRCVLRQAENHADHQGNINPKQLLEELLLGLEQSQREDLLQQLEDFKVGFWYYNHETYL